MTDPEGTVLRGLPKHKLRASPTRKRIGWPGEEIHADGGCVRQRVESAVVAAHKMLLMVWRLMPASFAALYLVVPVSSSDTQPCGGDGRRLRAWAEGVTPAVRASEDPS